MGFLSPWFLGGLLAAGTAALCSPAAAASERAAEVQLADVFRAAHAEFGQAPPAEVPGAARDAARRYPAARADVREPFHQAAKRCGGRGGRKHFVIAVDNSFSMRAGDRFERAKRRHWTR